MKKIIAINAGPRKGWNTDQLIKEAARGAETAGAEVEYIDLFRLEKFNGCIACFGCKRPETYGKCICKDGLTDVLEKIRTADGLIIGSPNYLSNLTAAFRALYERLVFQSLTYNVETPCCNEHKIPVILIMTSNCAEKDYEAMGYTALLESYQKMLGMYVGPTEVLTYGDSLQVHDYSQYNWTRFNPEAKQERHDTVFPSYLEKAFALGKSMITE